MYDKAVISDHYFLSFAVFEYQFPTNNSFTQFAPLLSTADRQALFGPLAFEPAPEPGNPEAIRITNGWNAQQVVKVVIPQLIGVSGASKTGAVWFHKKAAAQLQALLALFLGIHARAPMASIQCRVSGVSGLAMSGAVILKKLVSGLAPAMAEAS